MDGDIKYCEGNGHDCKKKFSFLTPTCGCKCCLNCLYVYILSKTEIYENVEEKLKDLSQFDIKCPACKGKNT